MRRIHARVHSFLDPHTDPNALTVDHTRNKGCRCPLADSSDARLSCTYAGLLEVNTGPVMGDEEQSLCRDVIGTVMDPLHNPSGEPIGGWEPLMLYAGN